MTALQVMQKMDGRTTSLQLAFADDIDLLEGSEELQQLTERLQKTAAGYGMEISSDKSKIYRQQHPSKTIDQHMDEQKNAGRSGQAQIPGIHTNERQNFNKGSKCQTGASILSHDKASNTM